MLDAGGATVAASETERAMKLRMSCCNAAGQPPAVTFPPNQPKVRPNEVCAELGAPIGQTRSARSAKRGLRRARGAEPLAGLGTATPVSAADRDPGFPSVAAATMPPRPPTLCLIVASRAADAARPSQSHPRLIAGQHTRPDTYRTWNIFAEDARSRKRSGYNICSVLLAARYAVYATFMAP